MLAKCANPKCSAVFRHLGVGKLFRLPVHSAVNGATAALEHFWLCPECVGTMTLAIEPNGRVVVLRRAQMRPYREMVGTLHMVPELNIASAAL